MDDAREEAIRAAAAHRPWYHTIELAPGVVTPGAFDLRTVAERMPWPDAKGCRCLDVGTYDGYLAFELERRGAREVVALDIPGHEDWDWPALLRARGPEYLAAVAGESKGRGFELARAALGSRVERLQASVYELAPERAGVFDVVVCGSLLLHLRDPVRALERIRSVVAPRGLFLSAEHVDLRLSLAHPRRPLARLGDPELVHWWIPNVAGHRRMLVAAGFEPLRTTAPYAIPYGEGHEPRRGARALAQAALSRLATGRVGVPHAAVLARPSA